MKRVISYAVLILVLFLIQNNIFAASSLITTVPNLLLILVFSFGFIRGSLEGMLIGFVCGLLSDVFFGNIIGLSAMLYAVLGYGIAAFHAVDLVVPEHFIIVGICTDIVVKAEEARRT